MALTPPPLRRTEPGGTRTTKFTVANPAHLLSVQPEPFDGSGLVVRPLKVGPTRLL